MKINCWKCNRLFTPTEMDHVPFFLCSCGAMNRNLVFNKFGYGTSIVGRQNNWTWKRNLGHF